VSSQQTIQTLVLSNGHIHKSWNHIFSNMVLFDMPIKVGKLPEYHKLVGEPRGYVLVIKLRGIPSPLIITAAQWGTFSRQSHADKDVQWYVSVPNRRIAELTQ